MKFHFLMALILVQNIMVYMMFSIVPHPPQSHLRSSVLDYTMMCDPEAVCAAHDVPS